ncbi:hypothetical protein DACRYDRAFT_23159 [Dacryopinax primogenitus]|uniref:Uncharacterized protein n=1 Tax=Dacryopinax primogenitus (strain DJM 731) TaxID=1858805 RepID=M5GAC2_DACPD|nr:uncharacterized protein DACRYDRAFT_23159 [Dacryopinax primogenitus]EJU00848.1 hypothetical protein DACRYDRAFT_23159 [Dacryopinax primogenitus]
MRTPTEAGFLPPGLLDWACDAESQCLEFAAFIDAIKALPAGAWKERDAENIDPAEIARHARELARIYSQIIYCTKIKEEASTPATEAEHRRPIYAMLDLCCTLPDSGDSSFTRLRRENTIESPRPEIQSISFSIRMKRY